MAKAVYIGVGGVARRVKNRYVGVSGVARFVRKGYIGVGGVARHFLYDFGTMSTLLSSHSVDTAVSSYSMTPGYGTLTLKLVTTTGGSSSSNYNGMFYAYMLALSKPTDYVGKTLAVTLSQVAYTADLRNTTIEFWGNSGVIGSINYPTATGSYSYTIPSGTTRIVFGIWNRYAQTSTVTYSSIKIDGVTVDMVT